MKMQRRNLYVNYNYICRGAVHKPATPHTHPKTLYSHPPPNIKARFTSPPRRIYYPDTDLPYGNGRACEPRPYNSIDSRVALLGAIIWRTHRHRSLYRSHTDHGILSSELHPSGVE